MFPKLIYTFPDEQYCDLNHFEKLFWNANFFQIFTYTSHQKKYIWKTITSSLSFNFWAKTFWLTFSKFYRTSQVCYRGKMEKSSKRVIDVECQEVFFRVFRRIDFYTYGWLFREKFWSEILDIRWYCWFLTKCCRLLFPKSNSTDWDENWRKTIFLDCFGSWFCSDIV